ncbi:MAG: NitT/TauT family transport system permease protein [Thermoleophilales bacterium]|nr:NitT/TauT family transport system permease protein [Thermoleophilales bacterium]
MTSAHAVAPESTVSAERSAAKKRRSWGKVMIPAVFIIVMGGWEAAVRLFGIEEYILPAPLAILKSFQGEWGEMLGHTWPTLLEAVLGYAIGNAFAMVLAALMAEFRQLEVAIYPYIIGLRSVPVVAIAPLLIIWFGFSIWPIVGAAALISFFPTLVNGIDGFKSTDTTTLELMRGLNASRWQTFRMVKLPNAAPYLFAALKISVASAMVGAVVGEWIAADKGLGYLTIVANNYVDTLLLFRAVVLISLIALVWFLSVMAIEAYVLRWKRRQA